MSSHLRPSDDLVQSRTQSILTFKKTSEDIFAKYERDFSENDEMNSTDDETDDFTNDEIETDDDDGTENEEDAVESALGIELQTILPLVCTSLSDFQSVC
jgi:hypothetical protein